MRAIDADLIDMFECHPTDWATGAIDPQEAQDMIDNAPTLEMEPVRYAYWEYDINSRANTTWWHCSECGQMVSTNNKKHKPFERYCPKCGAKMRKE